VPTTRQPRLHPPFIADQPAIYNRIDYGESIFVF